MKLSACLVAFLTPFSIALVGCGDDGTATSGGNGSSGTASGTSSTGPVATTAPGSSGGATMGATSDGSTGNGTTASGSTAADSSGGSGSSSSGGDGSSSSDGSGSTDSSSSGGESESESGPMCTPEGQSCAMGQSCCPGLNCCAGVPVPPGAEFCGAMCPISDYRKKRDFSAVDVDEVLDKVAALPITTWSYRHEDASIRHIGPMAQDFMASFEVGATDESIFVVDADGVSLAAIQALNTRLVRAESDNAELRSTIDRLEQRLDALEAAGASR